MDTGIRLNVLENGQAFWSCSYNRLRNSSQLFLQKLPVLWLYKSFLPALYTP